MSPEEVEALLDRHRGYPDEMLAEAAGYSLIRLICASNSFHDYHTAQWDVSEDKVETHGAEGWEVRPPGEVFQAMRATTRQMLDNVRSAWSGDHVDQRLAKAIADELGAPTCGQETKFRLVLADAAIALEKALVSED